MYKQRCCFHCFLSNKLILICPTSLLNPPFVINITIILTQQFSVVLRNNRDWGHKRLRNTVPEGQLLEELLHILISWKCFHKRFDQGKYNTMVSVLKSCIVKSKQKNIFYLPPGQKMKIKIGWNVNKFPSIEGINCTTWISLNKNKKLVQVFFNDTMSFTDLDQGNETIILESLFTTLEASSIFWGSWGSREKLAQA